MKPRNATGKSISLTGMTHIWPLPRAGLRLLYHCAETAHLRADDRLALATAEVLAQIGPAIQAETRRRGFPPFGDAGHDSHTTFQDLSILADQRRRARERAAKIGPAVRVSEYPNPAKFWEKFRQEFDQCPDKTCRIAFLIRELEEASPLKAGTLPMYGGNSTTQNADAIALLLVAEGDDAVEPLLACLEKDNRLTRWRPWTNRDPLGVRDLAREALAGISGPPPAGNPRRRR